MKSRLIVLKAHKQRAWVYPEHGFQLFGYERELGRGRTIPVIYAPDREREPSDRRYGNPILFPNPSPSHSAHGLDTWVWNGKVFAIPGHGFARNNYWHVLDQDADRVTAELVPNTSTQLAFPFDFRLRLTYRLTARGLALKGALENPGKEAFPYAFGFHPYLNTPLGKKGGVKDCFVALPSGTQVQSEDQWKTHSMNSFAAQEARCDGKLVPAIILLETRAKQLELQDRANGLVTTVSIEGSKQPLGAWVIWSASAETPYVCLEPWTDFPDALNRPTTRKCPPGATHEYEMRISVKPAR